MDTLKTIRAFMYLEKSVPVKEKGRGRQKKRDRDAKRAHDCPKRHANYGPSLPVSVSWWLLCANLRGANCVNCASLVCTEAVVHLTPERAQGAHIDSKVGPESGTHFLLFAPAVIAQLRQKRQKCNSTEIHWTPCTFGKSNSQELRKTCFVTILVLLRNSGILFGRSHQRHHSWEEPLGRKVQKGRAIKFKMPTEGIIFFGSSRHYTLCSKGMMRDLQRNTHCSPNHFQQDALPPPKKMKWNKTRDPFTDLRSEL